MEEIFLGESSNDPRRLSEVFQEDRERMGCTLNFRVDCCSEYFDSMVVGTM